MDYSDVALPSGFHSLTYIYNKDNVERGTRIAYETSLTHSNDEWLMLLDDDTSLTEGYLSLLLAELESNIRDTEIVAYCAKIYDGVTQISPTASETLDMLLFPKKAGVYEKDISGISSTLTLRKAFIEDIGAFLKSFPRLFRSLAVFSDYL